LDAQVTESKTLPTLHRFVVGAATKVPPLEEPQTPSAAKALFAPKIKQKEQQRKNTFTNLLLIHIFLFFAAPAAYRTETSYLLLIFYY
jgi:hypothetical protein